MKMAQFDEFPKKIFLTNEPYFNHAIRVLKYLTDLLYNEKKIQVIDIERLQFPIDKPVHKKSYYDLTIRLHVPLSSFESQNTRESLNE